MRRARGFTLIEVMVAMAVVAFGLIAVFNAINQMVYSTSMLRDRALADWIAMNEISTIRISGELPDVGNFNGTTEFAGREWRWEARVSETGVTDLRRIDMSVAHEDFPEDDITIVTGFMSRGVAALPTQIDWWGVGAPAPGPGEQEQDDVEPVEPAPAPPGRPRRTEQPEDDE